MCSKDCLKAKIPISYLICVLILVLGCAIIEFLLDTSQITNYKYLTCNPKKYDDICFADECKKSKLKKREGWYCNEFPYFTGLFGEIYIPSSQNYKGNCNDTYVTNETVYCKKWTQTAISSDNEEICKCTKQGTFYCEKWRCMKSQDECPEGQLCEVKHNSESCSCDDDNQNSTYCEQWKCERTSRKQKTTQKTTAKCVSEPESSGNDSFTNYCTKWQLDTNILGSNRNPERFSIQSCECLENDPNDDYCLRWECKREKYFINDGWVTFYLGSLLFLIGYGTALRTIHVCLSDDNSQLCDCCISDTWKVNCGCFVPYLCFQPLVFVVAGIGHLILQQVFWIIGYLILFCVKESMESWINDQLRDKQCCICMTRSKRKSKTRKNSQDQDDVEFAPLYGDDD